MSSPTIAFENIETLETADAIAVDRILHDPRIFDDLEKEFEPETVTAAVETADALRYASIESALPSASEFSEQTRERLETHAMIVRTLNDSMDHTMPGSEDVVLDKLEEMPEVRQFTAEESEVIFTALRKAASTKGYRREATDILARNAPTRLERLRHKVALRVGKIIA